MTIQTEVWMVFFCPKFDSHHDLPCPTIPKNRKAQIARHKVFNKTSVPIFLQQNWSVTIFYCNIIY